MRQACSRSVAYSSDMRVLGCFASGFITFVAKAVSAAATLATSRAQRKVIVCTVAKRGVKQHISSIMQLFVKVAACDVFVAKVLPQESIATLKDKVACKNNHFDRACLVLVVAGKQIGEGRVFAYHGSMSNAATDATGRLRGGALNSEEAKAASREWERKYNISGRHSSTSRTSRNHRGHSQAPCDPWTSA